MVLGYDKEKFLCHFRVFFVIPAKVRIHFSMILQSQVFKGFSTLIPPETATLFVAVSGGADSMALALLAHEYATANGLKVITVTVDHKLRPESSDEAIWVHQTLNNFGIAHQILVWNHEGTPNRLHERAREARYQMLLDCCKNYENPVLLTAHHQQDQAETILMRFLKGSGAAGFKGIQPIRLQQAIPIVRPLLEVDPKHLRNFLMEKNIAWVEDPSNDNPRYERTRVRALLRQINKDWGVGGILESAAKIGETQSTLDEVIAEYEKRFIVMDPRLHGDDKESDSFCHSRESGNPFSDVTPAKAGVHYPEECIPVTESIIINQTEFFKCPTQIQRQWLRHKIWQIGDANYHKPYKTIDAILKMVRQPRVNNYRVAGCKISVIKKLILLSSS